MSHQKRGQPWAPRRPTQAWQCWESPTVSLLGVFSGTEGAPDPGELGAGNRIQTRTKDRGPAARQERRISIGALPRDLGVQPGGGGKALEENFFQGFDTALILLTEDLHELRRT